VHPGKKKRIPWFTFWDHFSVLPVVVATSCGPVFGVKKWTLKLVSVFEYFSSFLKKNLRSISVCPIGIDMRPWSSQ
jgi:hypothetical protein